MVGASIGVKVVLDDSGWRSRIRRVKKDIDDTRVKTKDLGVEFLRATSLLKGLGKAGLVASAGVSAILTGALAKSPQFKAFIAKMQKPLFELGYYLGSELQPLFDEITMGAQHFVDTLRKLDREHGFLEKLTSGGTSTIKFLTKLDDQTGGLLTLLTAGLGLTLPLFITLGLTKTFIAWLAGALGLSAFAVTSVAGGIVIAGTILLGIKLMDNAFDTIDEQMKVLIREHVKDPGAIGGVVAEQLENAPYDDLRKMSPGGFFAPSPETLGSLIEALVVAYGRTQGVPLKVEVTNTDYFGGSN